jgi:ribonuclease P protein component
MGSMGGELFLKKHGDYQRVYREGRKGSAALMGWFVAGRGAPSAGESKTKSEGGESKTESAGESKTKGEGEESKTKGEGEGSGENSGEKFGVRVGLTVPRTLGKAVDRNRMKRRMREAVRRQPEELLTGARDVVLHPRRTVLTCEFERLEREVGKVLREVAVEGAGEKPRARVDREKTKAKPGVRDESRSNGRAAVKAKVRARTKASSNG